MTPTTWIRWIPVLVVAVVLVTAPSADATKKLAGETDRVCTVCHDKPGSKLLTDQGKFFETRRTLEGYDELMEEFGSCTHCHSRKPGSMKLTKAGKQHKQQLAVNDMEELCNWIKEHPDVQESGEATDSTEDTQDEHPSAEDAETE